VSAPAVSVVIGVRDAEFSVVDTVRSVLGQSLRDLECIVVDDGSRDATGQRLREVAASDARVRVIRQAPAGLTRALITGCAEAHAPLIARIDAGDSMCRERLAEQRAWMLRRPEVAVLASAVRLRGPDGEALDVFGDELDAGPPPREHDLTDGFLSEEAARLSGIPHMSVCLRRAAYRRAGGYRAAFRLTQDVDLWARMAQFGRLVRVERVLTEARVTLDGLSPRHHRTQLALREVVAAGNRVRREGGDEGALLGRAAAISAGALEAGGRREGAALFVAGCLARRGDLAACERYLRMARAAAPLSARPLAGLARLRLRRWLGMRA